MGSVNLDALASDLQSDAKATIEWIGVGRCDLPALFARLGYKRGAEVGVWEGGFSARLLMGIPDLSLMAVDPWKSYGEYLEEKNDPFRVEAAYWEARRRLKRWQKCQIVRAMSTDAAKSVPDRSLDFVYLDGNHAASYVKADLEAWAPKVRVGGVVSGHDYKVDAPKHVEVKGVVDDYVNARGIGPLCVTAADKMPSFLWMVR